MELLLKLVVISALSITIATCHGNHERQLSLPEETISAIIKRVIILEIKESVVDFNFLALNFMF